jgi:methyl-accepting chemotaxis protein
MLVVLGIFGVACISGFAKYFAVKKNNYMTVLQESQTVETVMLQMMMAEEKFINTLDSEHLSGLDDFRRRLNQSLTQIRSFDVGGGIADDAALMSKTEAEHAKIFQMTAQTLNDMSKNRADFFAKIASASSNLKKIIDSLEKEEAYLITQGETLPLDKDGLRKDLSDVLVILSDKVLNLQELMLFGNSVKFLEGQQAFEKKLDLKKKNVGMVIPAMKDFIKSWQDSEPILNEIKRLEDVIFDQWGKNKELEKTLQTTASQIQEKSKKIAESSKAVIDSSTMASDRISLCISVAGILILSGLGFLISKSINSSLGKSIAGLIEGAQQVASASGQVATASQELADGAVRQRASLEKTSSSLEEVSAMTKQNAQNASQANRLMAEAKQVVGKANQSMLELTESMGQISKANLETQKIIKTIDEIAFQTNLLALNAAVEAARAGESGAGFAVVADEVRNLAMRAAGAAKNTADLIEGTVKTVKEGSALVVTTSGEFNTVATTVSKSGELIGEIAAASDEQSRGIGEVSEAVADLNKFVENNASNAEESASASDEMNSQAEQMRVYVNELKSLVDGSKNKMEETVVKTGIRRVQYVSSSKIDPVVSAARQKDYGVVHAQKESSVQHPTREAVQRPEDVIPFDEGRVSDF